MFRTAASSSILFCIYPTVHKELFEKLVGNKAVDYVFWLRDSLGTFVNAARDVIGL